MNEKIKKTKNFIIDLIYPNCCPCCKKTIPINNLVCENCDKKLKKLQSMNITTSKKEPVIVPFLITIQPNLQCLK